MVASCGTYQIEYRVAREDGSPRCIEARGRVLPGPGRQPRPDDGRGGWTPPPCGGQARGGETPSSCVRAPTAPVARENSTAASRPAVTVEAIVAAVRDGLHAYGADSLIMVAEKDGRQESGRLRIDDKPPRRSAVLNPRCRHR